MKLYNTLTRKVEELNPLQPGHVRIYSCGPTVYNYAHIGNFRAYVFGDLLVRVLRFSGQAVLWVMNITDIDDKTIEGAAKAGLSLSDFTAQYEAAFFEDLKILNVLPADVYPRAIEHFKEMREIIQILLDKGLAYQADDGIYFDISKFKNYGHMARLDVKGLKAGFRVAVDSYEKEDVRDFALWKFSFRSNQQPTTNNQQLEVGGRRLDISWESEGRPGWHIECSAMSRKYLGQPFDIHTGGVDLIFPHHTNEIAQSAGAYGQPLATMFVHNEHLLVDGQKMSKSLKNFYTLRDIIAKGYDPLSLRYLYLQSHYREKMNFTFKALDSAQRTLEGVRGSVKRYLLSRENVSRLAEIVLIKKKVIEALADDLNSPKALSLLHDAASPALWLEFDQVFGLKLTDITAETVITKEHQKLINDREKLRQAGQFDEADKIRRELKKQGISVEDTPGGPRVLRG